MELSPSRKANQFSSNQEIKKNKVIKRAIFILELQSKIF
jgi:hypothetical protein